MTEEIGGFDKSNPYVLGETQLALLGIATLPTVARNDRKD